MLLKPNILIWYLFFRIHEQECNFCRFQRARLLLCSPMNMYLLRFLQPVVWPHFVQEFFDSNLANLTAQ